MLRRARAALPRVDAYSLDNLSLQVWERFVAARQSLEAVEQKQKVHARIAAILPRISGNRNVFATMTGSTVTGFGSTDSDLDLALIDLDSDVSTSSSPEDIKMHSLSILRPLSSQLIKEKGRGHYAQVYLIHRATVPVVRLITEKTGVSCDISVSCLPYAAVRNTHMLSLYGALDWRVAPLVCLLTEWAKFAGIHSPERRKLTSYGVKLMVLFYLQNVKPHPLVPVLHFDPAFRRIVSPTVELTKLNFNPKLTWKSRCTFTMGELVLGFFRFYRNFDFDTHGISVFRGKQINRSSFVHSQPKYRRKLGSNYARDYPHLIVIEEPYSKANVAYNIVNDYTLKAIRQAFADSYNLLETERDLTAIL